MRLSIAFPAALIPAISLCAAPAVAQTAGAPAAAPAPAPATEKSAPADDDNAGSVIDNHEIVVTANKIKIPGQVDAPQPAVTTLDEEDIQAYGVSSIQDLLDAIAPQTNSGRGRSGNGGSGSFAGGPVILVNGLRISSFRELRDFPPEAIRKVEILPEEVALRYGFPPDQRVVNFILKPHFRSRTVEAEAQMPTRGGTSTEKGEVTLSKIDRNKRFNIALKADHTSPLTEATRSVTETPATDAAGTPLPTVAGDPSQADNRTLVAKASDYSLNTTWTTALGKGSGPKAGSMALNLAVSRAETLGLSGLNGVPFDGDERTVPGALARKGRTDALQAGASINKQLSGWQLSLTADAGHSYAALDTTNRIDPAALTQFFASGTPLPPTSVTHTTSITNTMNSLATLVGKPVTLPAGPVSLTAKAGFTWSGYSGSTSAGTAVPDLHRGDVAAGLNLALPLTGRKRGVLGVLGDVTANLSAGLDQLSDFGTLTNWSAGLTWNLTDRLGFQASWIFSQQAPTLAQLGGPLTTTLNVPVYDFATGQTVLVTTTGGGNASLRQQSQHDLKLGVNWTLPFLKNSNILVEYFNNHSNDVTIAFPLLTPAVEAAFPGRVTRNLAGQIIAINERPVTLADQREERLRWGINLFGNLGQPLPPQASPFGMFGGGGGGRRGGEGGGRRGGGGGDGGPGGFGGPPPGGGPGGPGAGPGGPPPGGGGPGGGPGGRGPRYPGRWNFAFYHTIQFIDKAQLMAGGPVLDLLNGDALSGSGVARQSFEFDSGGFYKGYGVRFNGTWALPTHVDGSGVPGASDLRFGSVLKVNLRIFADLGQQANLVKHMPFLKGARLSLYAQNLLDSRQLVTDSSGKVPLSYQPDYLDPLGRVVGLELRKMF